jgi:hypothetical protein
MSDLHPDSLSPLAFTHEFAIAHLDGADDHAGGRDVEFCNEALIAFQRHIRRLWSRQLRRRASTVTERVRCCAVPA